jgi:formylglycine-generating enzyme required for sulfatase activity
MRKKIIFSILPCILYVAFVFGQENVIRQWTNPKDRMLFIQVPTGSITVQLGDTLETSIEKLPYQEITFDQPFLMGCTEVTVEQYRTFVEETGYITDAEQTGSRFNWKNPGFDQDESHPVVYLSFKDAKAYADWADVDLPKEVEWLYACCAGTTTKYYWGDEMQPDLFWHRENSLEGTHPVATNKPNPWGFYDMVGNAKEYCSLNDGGFSSRGESFARCVSYISSRNGDIIDLTVAESVRKILNVSRMISGMNIYYWDDDRGFRCIKREKQNE